MAVTEVKLTLLLHEMEFHWQMGTERFQLERRDDGSLEMEDLKDKRRWV